MKLLLSIPFLHGAEHSHQAIESVMNANVDLLLIDNGADNDVKNILNRYHEYKNVKIIRNETNIYVNPAWNQALKYFLDNPQYTHLAIMNSDIIMRDDWHEVLQSFFSGGTDMIPIPVISDNIHTPDNEDESYSVVTSGTPGVFIVLNREQANIVHPIPEEIKVWFGDNWIYDQLRGMDFVTVIPKNLHALHYCGGSQNVSRTKGVYEIIEQDKKNWHSLVSPMMKSRIELKNKSK